LAKNRPGP